MSDQKPASAHTRTSNEAILAQLPFDDVEDFEDVRRGFIAELPNDGLILDADGATVWDLANYAVADVGTDAPDSVNPSLWRIAQLLGVAGLFEVVPGIYQVRGVDLSVITFIEGPDGVVVVDPLTSAESAAYSLDLYRTHRGDRPIVAVIYTHSHIDHYAGVRGVVDEADVVAGRVQIVAPAGFLKNTLDEMLLAGNTMSRRSSYQYGQIVPGGPRGTVTTGLGLGPAVGTVTLIPPTTDVTETGQMMTLAGLEFEFMLAPDTEAPSEMFFYVPAFKALCPAECATHNQHNLYTLRGAKIRDAHAWGAYLHEARRRFADAEVSFAPHHWPTWGRARIQEHLKVQAAMYKYLHDQTLRLANHGYTMLEAAEMIELPESLARHWSTRGYYGTTSHNVKSVWNHYLGWYDGNPSHLWPHPPEPAARKYVEYMGGADAVLERARADFANGEYRWVAEVVNHVIFADPTNEAAKQLQADTFEQLGYQSEAGTWRNWYLTGAKELRDGILDLRAGASTSADTMRVMPVTMFLDYLAVRLNGPAADGVELTINLNITDTGEHYSVRVHHSVLDYDTSTDDDADATIDIDIASLKQAMGGAASLASLVESGAATLRGDAAALQTLAELLDDFEFWFPIVTP